jgi:hypothetical protein
LHFAFPILPWIRFVTNENHGIERNAKRKIKRSDVFYGVGHCFLQKMVVFDSSGDTFMPYYVSFFRHSCPNF